jgi:hypothetical protein
MKLQNFPALFNLLSLYLSRCSGAKQMITDLFSYCVWNNRYSKVVYLLYKL